MNLSLLQLSIAPVEPAIMKASNDGDSGLSKDIVLNVITLNCWDLKFLSKNRLQRIRAIAQYLNEQKYDLVFLQEVSHMRMAYTTALGIHETLFFSSYHKFYLLSLCSFGSDLILNSLRKPPRIFMNLLTCFRPKVFLVLVV